MAVAWAAEGAVTFEISNGSETGKYSVSVSGVDIEKATNVPLDTAIELIRIRANGGPVEIKFLSKNGGAVDLGDDRGGTVRIVRSGSEQPAWSDSITFSGKTKGGSFNVWGRPDMGDVYLKNTAKMEFVKGSFTVEAGVVLELEACTLSTEGDFLVVAQHTMWTGGPRLVKVKSGKYTSAGRVISAQCGVEISGGFFEAKRTVAVENNSDLIKISGGEFTSDSGYAVWAKGDGVVITRGTFISKGGNPTVRVEYGNGEITGGTFKADGGASALWVDRGKVNISNGAEFISGSETFATIQLNGGSVWLDSVKIRNGYSGGSAVNIFAVTSKLEFTERAQFDGLITSRFANAITVSGTLKPNVDRYKLSLLGAACVEKAVAVVGSGGATFSNFKLISEYYYLERKNNDAIVKLKDGVVAPQYVITYDANVGFAANIRNANKKDSIFKISDDIYGAWSAISEHADGRPCGIQFGTGGAIDIGTASIFINGRSGKSGWGMVTLSGAFTARRLASVPAATFALQVTNGAYVVSNMKIGGTHNFGVLVETGSEFTFAGDGSNSCGAIRNNGATVKVISGMVPYIENQNGGWLEVVGGTVGDDGRNNCAIRNAPNSQLVISDSAKIFFADELAQFDDGGTIVNRGNLVVSGGSVSNVSRSPGGASIAIINGPDATDTAATANITGTAKIFSGSTGESGVVCNMAGSMRIAGGHIYSTDSTTNNVVFNRGKLTITGNAVIETTGDDNINPIGATIYSETDSADVSGGGTALEILGGKIKAKDGYAVYIEGTGGALIAGTADITAEKPDGAVYIGYNATLKLYGGKVWSNSMSDSAIAIDAYHGSRYFDTGDGKLEMGGSPDVSGLISLTGNYNLPIKVNTNGEYAFNPPKDRVYEIAATVVNEEVVVKDGLNFRRNFVLDTVLIKNDADLGLVVNKNDIVAANAIRFVAFSVSDAIGGNPPDTIFVIKGGKIGESAMPETKSYASKDGRSNDGKWYIRVGEEFNFGVTPYNSVVDNNMTLTLNWVGPISVLSPSRAVPSGHTAESAVVAPVAVTASGSLTAGPNPVLGYAGAISLFWNGAPLRDGRLFIYDATGNVIAKVAVSDNSGGAGRRLVAAWDLRDAKGRLVADGTYVAKGAVTARSGRAERVSMLLSVQR
jgi:hypothetical protein